MYVLVASGGVLRNLRRGPTANLEQAKNRSEETAQKHICRRPSHCLHFNGSNSNKQYNWLPIVLLLFKQTMTSGTRDSMKYIRRGEEGERASDLGPSENQATGTRKLPYLKIPIIICRPPTPPQIIIIISPPENKNKPPKFQEQNSFR